MQVPNLSIEHVGLNLHSQFQWSPIDDLVITKGGKQFSLMLGG